MASFPPLSFPALSAFYKTMVEKRAKTAQVFTHNDELVAAFRDKDQAKRFAERHPNFQRQEMSLAEIKAQLEGKAEKGYETDSSGSGTEKKQPEKKQPAAKPDSKKKAEGDSNSSASVGKGK